MKQTVESGRKHLKNTWSHILSTVFQKKAERREQIGPSRSLWAFSRELRVQFTLHSDALRFCKTGADVATETKIRMKYKHVIGVLFK